MANIWEKYFMGPTSSRRFCCFSPHATNLPLAGLLLTIWSGCGIIIQVEIKRSCIRKQIDCTWPTIPPSVLYRDKDQRCDWLARSSQNRRLASHVPKSEKQTFRELWQKVLRWNFLFFKAGTEQHSSFQSGTALCPDVSEKSVNVSLLSHYTSKWIMLTEDKIIHTKSSNDIKTGDLNIAVYINSAENWTTCRNLWTKTVSLSPHVSGAASPPLPPNVMSIMQKRWTFSHYWALYLVSYICEWFQISIWMEVLDKKIILH